MTIEFKNDFGIKIFYVCLFLLFGCKTNFKIKINQMKKYILLIVIVKT